MIRLRTVLADVRRGGLLMLLLAGGLAGCQDHRRAVSPTTRPTSRPASDLAQLGKDRRVTLHALRTPEHQLARELGAHRLTCSSRLTTELPGYPARKIEQQVDVRVDGKGQYAALKTTDPQYGQEVIWTGEQLYPRLRWNKYVRRRAEPDEPARLLDRLAGLLPAYVRLLRRFLGVELVGPATYLGRETVRLRLGLEPAPAAATREAIPARRWRESLTVSRLEGEVQLDARTGAPLRAELRARWSFNPPAAGPLPPSGIPGEIDPKLTGATELHFSLKVSELGGVAPIKPPPEAETIDSPRLTRTEIERQMLTGELSLDDNWGPP